MPRRAPCLAVLVLLLAAVPARASTVQVTPDTANGIEYVSVDASTANVVTISPTATAGTYRLVDTGETVTVTGQGCTQVDTHTADCTTFGDNQPIRQVDANLGGGNDQLTNDTALFCICLGEAGNDTLTGADGNGFGDNLQGGPGTDTLIGRGGGDFLSGQEDADILQGGEGDDNLDGDLGADTLDGGNGSDRADYHFSTGPITVDLPEPGNTATATGGDAEGDELTSVESVTGTLANDVLTGNSGTNVLDGDEGGDTLNGQGAFDVLDGGDGSDTLNGGPGDDFLDGGAGNDFLFGEAGADSLSGDRDFDFPGLPPVLDERGDDLLDGGADLDTADYASRQSSVTAVLPATGTSSGNGDDGTPENDQIDVSVERINTGAGNDTLTGNGLTNVLDGGNGNDTLNGEGGQDTLRGANGGDLLNGGTEADSLSGDGQFSSTPGADTLNGDAGNDVLTADAGGDTLNGGADNDLLQGGAGIDTLRGDAGTDTLKGGADADDLGGGPDGDTAQYSDSTTGVKAVLPAATVATTGNGPNNGADDDTIQPDVENLVGSSFSDDLAGGGTANSISGLAGNDTIDVLGGGTDTVDCGADDDTATGDAGDSINANCENGGGGSTGDTVAPLPTLDAPGALTSESPVTFSGTAGQASGDLAGIEVDVHSGDSANGEPLFTLSATADGSGHWSVTRTTPLSAGTFTAVAYQRDSSANEGHSELRTFTVTAPAGAEPTATATATATPAATPAPGGGGLPPAPTVGPKVDGVPKFGAILSANVGGWINGVFQFKVAWRRCDKDGHSNCVPTSDPASFSHRVAGTEVGHTFLFAVTAVNSFGSSTRVSPVTAPATGGPEMPDVTRKPMITVKKAGTLLRNAGICTVEDPADCGTRMPVNLRLDGVGRDEVPKSLRRTIESGEIFAQSPADGTTVAQGDRVKLSFYSTKADKPTPCAYFNYSEARVRREFAGKPFSEVRQKLVAGQCEHGWSVVGKDFKLTESKVDDAGVDFNTRGDRFIQLRLIEPEPVNYKPVPQVDTDGDGIWDEWETKGVDANSDGTIDLDLAAMGADPRHKDLFVELDAMDGHPFSLDAVSDMAGAFAAGLINNPDGKTGVTLHLDAGKDAVMNPKTGAKWGSRSEANQVPHQDKLGSMIGNAYDWTAFQALKTANFNPARASVFRYVINMHNHPKSGVTGTARGIPGEPTLTGPSDIVVGGKNPCAAPEHCLLTRTEQAVNLMHELGHLLGLGHGGRSSTGVPNHINGKPNYLSIMSYSWSFTGVKIGSNFKIDFSPFPGSDEAADRLAGRPGSVAPLDENALTETPLTRAGGLAGAYAVTTYCPKATTLTTLNGAIDWDCADGVESAAQKKDINGDGNFNVLRSNDDWANMTFTGGSIGDFNMVLPTQERQVIDEPTYEQQQHAAQAARGDFKAPSLKAARSGRRLKVTATDDKQLAQVTVQIDKGAPKVYPATGAKLTKTVRLPRGRHRVLVEAVDLAGNRSKRKSVRYR